MRRSFQTSVQASKEGAEPISAYVPTDEEQHEKIDSVEEFVSGSAQISFSQLLAQLAHEWKFDILKAHLESDSKELRNVLFSLPWVDPPYHLLRLPRELQAYILSYLPYKDKIRAREVCGELKRLVEDVVIWPKDTVELFQ